jgi:hypothetical protein
MQDQFLLITSLMMLGFAVLACAACAPPLPRAEISTDETTGLRTYERVLSAGEPSPLCHLGKRIDQLAGHLEADDDASVDPVRIRLADGRSVVIVWPKGFTIGFEPTAVLYDENSRPVAREGELIEFPQIGVHDQRGTYEDPYIASGFLFGRCYALFD